MTTSQGTGNLKTRNPLENPLDSVLVAYFVYFCLCFKYSKDLTPLKRIGTKEEELADIVCKSERAPKLLVAGVNSPACDTHLA